MLVVNQLQTQSNKQKIPVKMNYKLQQTQKRFIQIDSDQRQYVHDYIFTSKEEILINQRSMNEYLSVKLVQCESISFTKVEVKDKDKKNVLFLTFLKYLFSLLHIARIARVYA